MDSPQPTTTHERYYRLGKNYWWFYGKYRLVLSLLKTYVPAFSTQPIKIFDAGCGPGHFMELLREHGELVGTDYAHERILFARREGYLETAQADLRSIPFQDASFDLITTIDTIEHIREDRAALQELLRVLKPGGVLALTVPAFMLLWGSHDENQGHHKRYRVPEMEGMLAQAGFEVIKATYAELVWFLPLLGIRKLKALKEYFYPAAPKDDFLLFPDWINAMLTGVIVAEAPLLKRRRLPFGVTMICLAKKPHGESLL